MSYRVGFVCNFSTLQDVTQAFRRLARKRHPDKGGSKEDFQRLRAVPCLVLFFFAIRLKIDWLFIILHDSWIFFLYLSLFILVYIYIYINEINELHSFLLRFSHAPFLSWPFPTSHLMLSKSSIQGLWVAYNCRNSGSWCTSTLSKKKKGQHPVELSCEPIRGDGWMYDMSRH